MLTDIEIAQQAKMKKITEIAANLGIEEDEVEQYGHYKAKLNQKLFNRLADKPDGKLILVTAINPTPAGEGKTTTSVGLCEAMNKTGRKAILALPGIRNQGRSRRRRLFPGSPDGGHKLALHRRYARHHRCKQPARSSHG